jgi:hypothetical protein
VYDFIKYRSLRNVSVLLVLFWAVVYVIDFGLLFCAYQYGAEVHQNWMLICVAGVFGGFQALFRVMGGSVRDQLSLKRGLLLFSATVTLSCAIAAFLQPPFYCFDSKISCFQEKVVIFCAMVTILEKTAKFAVTIVRKYLDEATEISFPQVVRDKGIGIGLFGGKIGKAQYLNSKKAAS